jgi:hypothetical protein
LLGVKLHRLVYALEANKVPRPATMLGRMAWTQPDVDRLRAYFEDRGDKWQRTAKSETREEK